MFYSDFAQPGQFLGQSLFIGTAHHQAGPDLIFAVHDRRIATLYTVLKEDVVEEFDIAVDSIIYGRKKTPYLTIKIIDQDLIARTGGIVKGMSGSPIVQDGKLIGALSHLSAVNSQRGYAVFIGKMLEKLQ